MSDDAITTRPSDRALQMADAARGLFVQSTEYPDAADLYSTLVTAQETVYQLEASLRRGQAWLDRAYVDGRLTTDAAAYADVHKVVLDALRALITAAGALSLSAHSLNDATKATSHLITDAAGPALRNPTIG